MNWNKLVKVTDMHTAGEPLRIIEKIYPDFKLEGNTILDKQDYLRKNDWLRKFVIDEPRGHRDMYAAFLFPSDDLKKYDIGVIFMTNEGYSSMCGHAIIALTRYVIDKELITDIDNKEYIRFLCPCGIVESRMREVNGKLMTSFMSVPSYVVNNDIPVQIEDLPNYINVDIVYGGAFYGIVYEKDFNFKFSETDVSTFVDVGMKIKSKLNDTFKIHHPTDNRLAFLYGIIFIENPKDSLINKSLTIFANKSVDRSPCGSCVTAMLANLHKKSNNSSYYHKLTRFQNLIFGQKSEFTARIWRENVLINIDNNRNEIGVVVEVTGNAYYTGESEFMNEQGDPFKDGFQIYL